MFIAYYCGGYVASRMARFNGIRQGIAVWLWAVVVAIAVAILAAVAGSKFNILAQLNSFPRIPVSEGSLTTLVTHLAYVEDAIGSTPTYAVDDADAETLNSDLLDLLAREVDIVTELRRRLVAVRDQAADPAPILPGRDLERAWTSGLVAQRR